MNKFLHGFEKHVIVTLVAMMIVVVLLSTIELRWIIYLDIVSPSVFMLEINELPDIFGFFWLILIGVELLETIKA